MVERLINKKKIKKLIIKKRINKINKLIKKLINKRFL